MKISQARPRLWIVAGPNGCGKSTAYSESLISGLDGSVWIINPDALTTKLVDSEGLSQDKANLEAVIRIEKWLHHSVDVYQTIGVETVLASDKYRRLVRTARTKGYEIRLIYVIVDSVETQLDRIRYRVEKGGHDVPEQKVRSRRGRSLEQLRWFYKHSDFAWVIDNTQSEPQIVLEWEPGSFSISEDLLPEVQMVLFGKMI